MVWAFRLRVLGFMFRVFGSERFVGYFAENAVTAKPNLVEIGRMNAGFWLTLRFQFKVWV